MNPMTMTGAPTVAALAITAGGATVALTAERDAAGRWGGGAALRSLTGDDESVGRYRDFAELPPERVSEVLDAFARFAGLVAALVGEAPGAGR